MKALAQSVVRGLLNIVTDEKQPDAIRIEAVNQILKYTNTPNGAVAGGLTGQ